jgi:hypothetical protein
MLPDLGRMAEVELRLDGSASQEIHVSEKRVQTVELTGKAWKAVMIVGALAASAGVVWIVMDCINPAAYWVLIVGMIVYMLGRIGAWWFHG